MDLSQKKRKMGSSCALTLSRIIPYIEEDVMIEILIRLPYKTLCKFKCVSKQWLSLLSNPTFKTRWLLDSNIPTWVFFYNFELALNLKIHKAYPNIYSPKDFIADNLQGFSFQFLISKLSLVQQDFPECDEIKIKDDYYKSELYLLGSSNGLVLCKNSHMVPEEVYLVGNPVTEYWAHVTPPPPLDRAGLIEGLYAVGFICCESSDSGPLKSKQNSSYYIVVHIPLHTKAVIKFNIELFSSATGSWDVYEVSCPQQVMHKTKNPAITCHNEVLYWLVVDATSVDILLAYDLKNAGAGSHPCRLIELPERADCPGCLGKIGGFISYSHCSKGILCVWLLEDDYTTGLWKWHLTQKVNLKDMIFEDTGEGSLGCKGFDQGDMFRTSPLAFHPMDQNVLFIGCQRSSLGTGPSLVFMYNFETKLLKQLRRDLESRYVDRHLPFVLIPSLETL